MRAATIRRSATRLLDRRDALVFFSAQSTVSTGDPRGLDARAEPGPVFRFRGAFTSQKTGRNSEKMGILCPLDIRARLGSPPDETISIIVTDKDGVELPDEVHMTIDGSPRSSAELRLRAGIGLTLIHVSQGAAG